MDLNKLRELLRIVAESDVAEVEIDEDGAKVTIRKDPPTIMVQSAGYYPPPPAYYPSPGMYAGPAPEGYQGHVAPPVHTPAPAEPATQEAPAPAAKETVVRAPIVGTYYQSPSPDSEPYVRVGSAVTVGTVLCIIEAMKLMNEIECEVTGTIKQMLVQDNDPVEYDQPLFVIETA